MSRFLLTAGSFVFVLVLSTQALARQVPAVTSDTASSFGIHLVAGPASSSISEPSGFGAERAQRDAGWLVGAGLLGRGAHRLGAAAEILAGRMGASEFLASRTVPFRYRFTNVEAALLVQAGFGAASGPVRRVYVGAGMSLSRRLAISITDDTARLTRAPETYAGVVINGGLSLGNLIVEGRYNQDINHFVPSFVTTASGVKRANSFELLLGYRLR